VKRALRDGRHALHWPSPQLDHGARQGRATSRGLSPTSGSSSASTSTSPSTRRPASTTSPTTTRIREALPTIKLRDGAGREGDPRVAHGPAEARQARGPLARGRGAASPSSLGSRSTSPRTASATPRRRSSTTCAPGRSACSRTSASTRKEKDDEAFARQLAELATSTSTTPSARAPGPRVGARAAQARARSRRRLPPREGARARSASS
jgi:hypothetical protein